MPLLQAEELSVSFEQQDGSVTFALSEASFALNEGDFCLLIGPSGAGKTSLVKAIAGQLDYDGRILLKGKDLRKTKIKDRNLSYCDQDFTLYPNLTVYENLAFPLRAHHEGHDEVDQAVKEMAHAFDLDYLLTRKPKYLSLGQAGRVALGRALIKPSDLFLFDEPLRNVDPNAKRNFFSLVKDKVQENQGAAILITHDVEVALPYANRVLALKNRKKYCDLSAEDFLSSGDVFLQELRFGRLP